MAQRLRLHGILEVPIGIDEVVGEILRTERLRIRASIQDVCDATGADAEEIGVLERGVVTAFPDLERMRLVILAYCDYLEIDPTPLLARFESYGRWQMVASPNLFAVRPAAWPGPALSRIFVALFAAVFAGVIALVTRAGF